MHMLSLIFSSSLYAAIFLWPTFCWPLSFVCFVPLFANRFDSYKKAFYSGFIWSAIAYGLSLGALFNLMYVFGNGWYKYLCISIFFGLFCVSTVLWFVSVKFIKIFTRSWFLSWIIATCVYFEWITRYCFYPCIGQLKGYGLACPLIALQKQAFFLSMLPVFGWSIVRFFLIVFQAGIAFKKKYILMLAFFFFGILNYFCYKKPKKVDPENKIILIPQIFKEAYPYERMFEIKHLLEKKVEEYPEAELFVFPESTFPFPLQEYPQAVTLWASVMKDKKLLLGSHRLENQELYNSVFLISSSRIMECYDKKHTMPFFETPSSVFLFKNVHACFLQKKKFFTESVLQKNMHIDEKEVCIRICSELLWDFPKNKSIFLLVKDSFFRYSYYPELLALYAQFQAHLKKSELFYCSWKISFKFSIM